MPPTFNLSLNSFFAKIPLFAPLDAEELSEVLRLVRPFVREAGERLFDEGDPADGMYVIERGEALVITEKGGDRVTLAELGNGAVIGELALIDGAPRSASVETIAMASGYWLSSAHFSELRESGSLAAYKVVRELARTLEDRKRVTERRLRGLIESTTDSTEVRSKPMRELFGRLLKG